MSLPFAASCGEESAAGREVVRYLRCCGLVNSETAVSYALRWLARHQNADGSWGASNFTHQCIGAPCVGNGDPDCDVGVTGLALLAFTWAGYTLHSKEEVADPNMPGRKLKYGDVVRHGLRSLLSQQELSGSIGRRGIKPMYNHVIAALALCEARRVSDHPSLEGPAQRAIDYLVASQNPGRGWRYTSRPGDNDTSVTGWAVLALKSAELAGLKMAGCEPCNGALLWLNEATDPADNYRTGYNSRLPRSPLVPCRPDSFKSHATMTAVSVLGRLLIKEDWKDPALDGVELLLSDLPQNKSDFTDYYYWFWSSLATYRFDGPAGPAWKMWNAALRDSLIPHQKTAKDGCANGSWTSEDERWGFEGGRVYATAINALTLEVYYRYPNAAWGKK